MFIKLLPKFAGPDPGMKGVLFNCMILKNLWAKEYVLDCLIIKLFTPLKLSVEQLKDLKIK